jgi:hypothetical protein
MTWRSALVLTVLLVLLAVLAGCGPFPTYTQECATACGDRGVAEVIAGSLCRCANLDACTVDRFLVTPVPSRKAAKPAAAVASAEVRP